MICFLSGLEIPKGKNSREHYFPRSLIPQGFHTTRNNIFPAHKVINEIKGCLKPCVWEEKKFDRVFFAIEHYDIRSADREFCRKTLENWEQYRIDPCVWCIMNENCKRR
jgi:hypothetical protein